MFLGKGRLVIRDRHIHTVMVNNFPVSKWQYFIGMMPL